MEYHYCPNCGKERGYKRALGWGTFFAAVITGGLWILAIPLYPKRCVECGKEEWWSSGYIYTCPKCGYKSEFNHSINLYVCPQCHHEAPVSRGEVKA